MSVYPGALDEYMANRPISETEEHTVAPDDFNDSFGAIDAIEGVLGLNPQGSAASVAARILALEGGGGGGAVKAINAFLIPQSAITEVGGGVAGKLFSSPVQVECESGYIVFVYAQQAGRTDWRNMLLLLDGDTNAGEAPVHCVDVADKIFSVISKTASAGNHTIDIWTYSGSQFLKALLHSVSGDRDSVVLLVVIGY